MKPTVKVSPEYGAWPLWVSEGGSIPDNIDARDLPISSELADQIMAWNDAFDRTYVRKDPVLSGFPSPEAEAEFVAEGEQLARRLAAELGDTYAIRYRDIRTDETKAVE